MKIYLIGYRATGKSSVAAHLAKQLALEKISLDDEFIKEHGPIARFVEDYGWHSFRDMETQLLESASSKDDVIIDCGGGVILREKNRELLKSGKCIWLQASVETIVERLEKDGKTVDQRPSLTGRSDEVEHVLKEREPLYWEAADHMIDTDGRDMTNIVEEIVNITKNC